MFLNRSNQKTRFLDSRTRQCWEDHPSPHVEGLYSVRARGRDVSTSELTGWMRAFGSPEIGYAAMMHVFSAIPALGKLLALPNKF